MYRRARLSAILVVCVSVSSLFIVDGTRPSYAQGSETVQLTLNITAASKEFTLTAEKQVAQGVNALEAIREIVTLQHTTHPEFGPFITELAGVSPPGGCCWLLYQAGEWSNLGIAGITLEGDTVLEFRSQ